MRIRANVTGLTRGVICWLGKSDRHGGAWMTLQLKSSAELLVQDVHQLEAEGLHGARGHRVGEAHAVIAHPQLKLPVWLTSERHPDVSRLPMREGVLEAVRDEFIDEERTGNRRID